MNPRVTTFSSEEINLLRSQFEKLPEVFPFRRDPKLAAKIASLGMFREVGTVNDEAARFIFDTQTGNPVRRESLKAELIEWNGLWGLRIYSEDTSSLDLRCKGFYELIHPTPSFSGETLHSLYIFPEIIYKIAEAQGIELVIVKSWGKNSIFGGFDPAKGYYQTNFWEIENNDVLKFSDLVRQGRLAFMGTHDLIAHIAAIDPWHWPLLKSNAEKVYQAITSYFKSVAKPSVAALILPYTIGVVLDDLAQPPSYSSKSHLAVLDELLSRLSKNEIPAGLPTILSQFPESFQRIIDLSRVVDAHERPQDIRETVRDFVSEILKSSAYL